MMSASLNRCKRMEDQARDFLKQLAAKLELVLLKLVTVNKLIKYKQQTMPNTPFIVKILVVILHQSLENAHANLLDLAHV